MQIELAHPLFDEEMKNSALSALENEKFVMGESVFKFEEEFARFCNVKHAVSTSSGMFALQASLQALGIKQGQGVLTTPLSFVATANSIVTSRSTPIFSDIDEITYNVSPLRAKELLNRDIKFIMPVHLYGYPADMESIMALADGRPVIEDCCQAHGALYCKKKVGSIGAVGCFSFYPAKNMTVGGDGGMAVTDDEETAKKIAKLRDCGRISHYEHDEIGYTARLNTVNAAIGRVQLRRLETWNEKRRIIARMYNKLLSDIPELGLPPQESSDISPVYHLYVIRTPHRDQLKSYLEANGIQCGVHYPIPIHLQPVYRRLFGYKEGSFPKSESAAKQVLSLPMHPSLDHEEISQISEKIHVFFRNSG